MRTDKSKGRTGSSAKAGLSLDDVVKQNIKTVKSIEKATKNARSPSDKVADKIASFCGSMYFVWVHIIWFSVWLAVNGLPFVPKAIKFDPAPFGVLTLVVSLEAIFLSTFILISQNRQQELADQRNELDLQVNLLAEQESSHTILLLTTLLKHHGVPIPDEGMQAALESDTDASRLATAAKKIVSKKK